MCDIDTQENWKKDVKEMISSCMMQVVEEVQVMAREGCKENIQKLQSLLCVSQCMPFFFV